jgi:hypothetical protein
LTLDAGSAARLAPLPRDVGTEQCADGRRKTAVTITFVKAQKAVFRIFKKSLK